MSPSKKIPEKNLYLKNMRLYIMHLRSTRRSQQLPPPDSSKKIIFHFSRLDIFAELANPEFQALILVAAAK
jgi:hypothetical protein